MKKQAGKYLIWHVVVHIEQKIYIKNIMLTKVITICKPIDNYYVNHIREDNKNGKYSIKRRVY